MTRFNITLEEGVGLGPGSPGDRGGGKSLSQKFPAIVSPMSPEAIAPGLPNEIVGIRPGEKLHEEMVDGNGRH